MINTTPMLQGFIMTKTVLQPPFVNLTNGETCINNLLSQVPKTKRLTRRERRERIARLSVVIADGVTRLLRQAGCFVQTRIKQAGTGTVYLAVLIFATDGRRLHGYGAVIRISDHRANPSDRWVNFSRPAQRCYGIWVFTSPWKIVRKVDRIGRNIVQTIRRKGGVQ